MIELMSTIVCPHCAQSKIEKMPTNSCQYFYQCTYCKEMLKPQQGDCCVFCSYADIPCPPIQEDKGHCCG